MPINNSEVKIGQWLNEIFVAVKPVGDYYIVLSHKHPMNSSDRKDILYIIRYGDGEYLNDQYDTPEEAEQAILKITHNDENKS